MRRDLGVSRRLDVERTFVDGRLTTAAHGATAGFVPVHPVVAAPCGRVLHLEAGVLHGARP